METEVHKGASGSSTRIYSHRGTLIHAGSLRTYESESNTQGELENESVEYLYQHPQMRDEIRVAACLFREFKRQYKLEPVALEKCVWSTELQYAGRLDFAGRFTDPHTTTGKTIRILMDIKTGKNIYDSVSKQLSAYNKCLNDWAEGLYVLLLHCGKTVINGVSIGATKPFWLFQEIQPNFEGFLDRLDWFKVVESRILNGEWKK